MAWLSPANFFTIPILGRLINGCQFITSHSHSRVSLWTDDNDPGKTLLKQNCSHQHELELLQLLVGPDPLDASHDRRRRRRRRRRCRRILRRVLNVVTFLASPTQRRRGSEHGTPGNGVTGLTTQPIDLEVENSCCVAHVGCLGLNPATG